jgi:hypothetical protein
MTMMIKIIIIIIIDMFFSPNVIRMIKLRGMRWAGHVACMGERRGAYRILVGIPEGRRPLGRTRLILEDNIKMDLQEVGMSGGHGLDLAVVNAVVNLRVPYNSGNFLTS